MDEQKRTERLDRILGVCEYGLLCCLLGFNGWMLLILLKTLFILLRTG